MKSGYSQSFLKNAEPLTLLALVLTLLAGCAAPGNSEKGQSHAPKYVFFPPAPDEPHVQFLTAFNSERDLRGSKSDGFLTYLTGQQPRLLPILKPYGGHAGGGKFYVCDTGQQVILKMDLAAKKMSVVTPDADGAILDPYNLAVDTNGWLYVVDMVRKQLVVLDDQEHFVGTVGEKGQHKLMDVALTGDRIYLSDVTDHNVHVLDKLTRTHLFDIPRNEDQTNLVSRLFQPINITLDAQGRLYVSDLGASQVKIFDANGKFLRAIGQHAIDYGCFFRNKGVAVDRNNYVYVADAAFQNVQIFDEQGRLLMPFGGAKANQASMQLPTKVLVDYDDVSYFQKYAAPNFQVEHLLVVLNQGLVWKVSVYGFGHLKKS